MKAHFLLASLLLSAASLGTAGVAHAVPVSIGGTAHNGTNKNAPLPNATVDLVASGKNDEQTVVATTTTDSKGNYRFPAKEWGEVLLFTRITYQGYPYFAPAYDGGSGLKPLGINIVPQKVDMLVFDSTNQPKATPLSFRVHHLALKSTATGLHCIERIVVDNPSKFTYTGFGPRKISVLLNIPPIAKNIQLDPGTKDGKMLKTADGWGISMPILPKSYGAPNALLNAIIFSYDVDWPSSLPWAKSVDLSREAIYPTNYFFVARETDDKELQVSAPQLGAEQTQELPSPTTGQTEVRLVNSVGSPMPMPGNAGPSVKPGEQLDVKISRPVSGLFWGFAGLVLALLVFLPLALVKPKRGERTSDANVSSHTSARGAETAVFSPLNGYAVAPTLTPSSRDLIQKIADLDDAFEARQVDEPTYQTQRAAWKKQLIDSLASSPDEH